MRGGNEKNSYGDNDSGENDGKNSYGDNDKKKMMIAFNVLFIFLIFFV